MISDELRYKQKVHEVEEKMIAFFRNMKYCKGSDKKQQLQKEYREYCATIKYW